MRPSPEPLARAMQCLISTQVLGKGIPVYVTPHEVDYDDKPDPCSWGGDKPDASAYVGPCPPARAEDHF